MTDKARTYAAVALSGAGFVVLDGGIASEQRPDLFAGGGIEAGGLLDARVRESISGWPGLKRLRLRLEGIEHDLLMLTRWQDKSLPRRVERVIGRAVVSLAPWDAPRASATYADRMRARLASLHEGSGR